MEIVWRVFGIGAGINNRLGRIRVNFVPLSWVLLFWVGVFLLVSVGFIAESAGGTELRHVDIAGALDNADSKSRYVEVRGVLLPALIGEYGPIGKHTGHARNTYGMLVDQKSKRALLVKYKGDGPEGDEVKTNGTVTGMLQPRDAKLRDELEPSSNEAKLLNLDSRYMLVAGDEPVEAGAGVTGTVIFGIMFLALTGALVKKNIVFRRDITIGGGHNSVGMPQALGTGTDLRVSGELALDYDTRRRFLNVPAGAAVTEDSQVIICSNLDASTRFMGFITVNKLAGPWRVAVSSENLERAIPGRQYVGFGSRPALLARAVNGQSVVLSFDSAAERNSMINGLREAGRTMPAWSSASPANAV